MMLMIFPSFLFAPLRRPLCLHVPYQFVCLLQIDSKCMRYTRELRDKAQNVRQVCRSCPLCFENKARYLFHISSTLKHLLTHLSLTLTVFSHTCHVYSLTLHTSHPWSVIHKQSREIRVRVFAVFFFSLGRKDANVKCLFQSSHCKNCCDKYS